MKEGDELGLTHVTAWIIRCAAESFRRIAYRFANEASEMRTPSPAALDLCRFDDQRIGRQLERPRKLG